MAGKKGAMPKGRPFKPGQTGNPKGRPKKGESMTDILGELAGIKDVTLPSGEKVTRKRALVERLWAKAIRDGDTTAIKFIIERLDGKTPQVIQGPDDEDGNPIPVAVVQVVRKRSIDEWQQEYTSRQSSGSPSPDKPKPSRARRSSSSSEGQREEEKH